MSMLVPDPVIATEPDNEAQSEVAQLRDALDTRDAIGQAKGIIRLLTHSDSNTAFYLLTKMSQDTNRRVKDLAVLFTHCAATGRPLPPDLSASWQRRTNDLLPAKAEPSEPT